MNPKNKKMILSVSFCPVVGKVNPENRSVLENEIKSRYPDYAIDHVYIPRQAAKKSGLTDHALARVLEQLIAVQCRAVLIQPIHMLLDQEYKEYILSLAYQYQHCFSYLGIGSPLLCNEQDCDSLARSLEKTIPLLQADQAVILAVPGSDQPAAAIYSTLQLKFFSQKERVFIVNPAGYPHRADIMPCLEKQAVKQVFVIPFNLTAGNGQHKKIEAGRENSWLSELIRAGYQVKHFAYSPQQDPLICRLFSEKLAQIVPHQLDNCSSPILEPAKIEKQSFEIIKKELDALSVDRQYQPTVHRIIHTSGDFEYAHLLRFSRDFVQAGKRALQNGCRIYSDTKMIIAGVNQKSLAGLGCEIFTLVDDPQVRKNASQYSITRSMAAMQKAVSDPAIKIFMIGNAPTALNQLTQSTFQDQCQPDLIIAVPVGFVGAAEAKQQLKRLAEMKKIDYITVLGRKGGSPIAAAILNSLLYQAVKERSFY